MGDNNDTMSGRFRHGRQGPGNAVSRFLRGAVWALPGGREAFPEGGDGTIWWGRNASLGDHAGGNTVLGAAARGAIDPTGQLLPTGGDTGLRARGLGGAAARVSDAAAQRVGSVVGRGFIGRSGREARYVEPRNALGYQLGQVPGGSMGGGNWSVATAGRGTGTAPTQAEIDAMAAEQGGFPISPSANRPTPMRDGRGGYNGRSWASARGVGQGMRRTNEQALQEVMEQMERWRNRGGLLQER